MTSPGAPQVPPRQVSAWNIANALTVLRILLVPVFGWLLLHDGGASVRYRLLAAGVFTIAIITDRIDGDIARSRGLVTDFGKVTDPIADKALMGMAFVGLSILGELSWWVTLLVLCREIGVTALRFFVIRHGVIPASRGGKVKTVLQAVAAGLYVLPLSGWPHTVAVAVMALAVIVTLVTGVDYVLRARTLRRTSPRALAKKARREAAAQARAERAEARAERAEARTEIRTEIRTERSSQPPRSSAPARTHGPVISSADEGPAVVPETWGSGPAKPAPPA